jgi:acetyl esterase/lipase
LQIDRFNQELQMNDLLKLLDDEQRAVLAVMPQFDLNNLGDARESFGRMLAAMAAAIPQIDGVKAKDLSVAGPEGAPEIRVRVYRPETTRSPVPGLLWMHGGGFVLGSLSMDDAFCKCVVRDCGCCVVSVEYRLAPEHPFPAGIEDCYAALKWVGANAAQLGVNRSRISIGGSSAGGGLAAGLALMARDRREVPVAFQFLNQPMIDDRNITLSSREDFAGSTWTRESNAIAWRSYLGGAAGGTDVSSYAAPARAKDLAGLPPAYVAIGQYDTFRDEDIVYAQRLLQAGVPTDLHVYPRAIHGCEMIAPTSAVCRRWIAQRDALLKDVLSP